MTLVEKLLVRAQSRCELCSDTRSLTLYEVRPFTKLDEDSTLIVCQKCRDQIDGESVLDFLHWHCLSGSVWSEYRPVKVMVYRILSQLQTEAWARELRDELDLEPEEINCALAGFSE